MLRGSRKIHFPFSDLGLESQGWPLTGTGSSPSMPSSPPDSSDTWYKSLYKEL